MNTFENELSTKNLVTLLASKEGVSHYEIDVEDTVSLISEKMGDMLRIGGPARVLIVID